MKKTQQIFPPIEPKEGIIKKLSILLPTLAFVALLSLVGYEDIKERYAEKINEAKEEAAQYVNNEVTNSLMTLQKNFCNTPEAQKQNAQLLTVNEFNEDTKTTETAIFIPYCEPKPAQATPEAPTE